MISTIFASKADTLKFLKKKITKSKIEQIYDFMVEEWEKNEAEILNSVIILFNDLSVIIRSSAIGEDTIEKSEAGNFTSILNVNSASRTELKKSIKTVINSYKKRYY